MNRVPFLSPECNLADENEDAKTTAICKALSSEERIKILRLLRQNSKTVTQLAKELFLSVSTVRFHIQLLQEAGMVELTYVPSKKGKLLTCQLKFFSAYLFFSEQRAMPKNEVIQELPVGHYIEADLQFPSGFCTREEQIMFDEGIYFIPKRVQAEVLWCTTGYVVYPFVNARTDLKLKKITFSLELCSEAMGYEMNWKSDITFRLNGKELLTYTSPSDFGGRRGILTPDWIGQNATQYGELITIAITKRGCFLNEHLIQRDLTIQDFYGEKQLLLWLGNKKNAVYNGGFNVFGAGFGDYPQGIRMKLEYEEI